jgi:hypothetical protein
MTLSRTEPHSPTPLFYLEQPAAYCPERLDQRIGEDLTQPVTHDLFSEVLDRNFSSPSLSISKPASQPRHILPRDLPSAIRHLGDQELDRLIAAVLAEQKRRGGKLRSTVEPPRKKRIEAASVPLTTGKLNAVRAAFKAGVKPTQIARQFGLSDADVRRALASDERKR